MKTSVLITLCFALVAGIASAQQRAQIPPPKTTSPPSALPLTQEKAFFYFIAIYGTPVDVVKRYGSYFDAANYSRAMADEFERGRYTERMQARIATEVGKIDFREKFTATVQTMFGEYSFGSHSFPGFGIPQMLWCIDAGRSFFGNCTGSVMHVDLFLRQDAVNAADFTWSLPMPEAEASAFVKSRSAGQSGGVDRSVTARITYSILNKKGPSGREYPVFVPFIYSVEVYDTNSLTKKLGVIPKINSQTPGSPEEQRAAEERIKEEAPEKLRALFATHPVLDGTYSTGNGPAKLALRVLSFDSGTGSVSAEVDFLGGGAPQNGGFLPLANPAGAVGDVSGDTLNLTATWNVDFLGKVTPHSMHLTLRVNGPARKLVGQWCNGTKACTNANNTWDGTIFTSTASFDLK